MYVYIYLNFVLWFQCIIHVLLGDANKDQSKEKFEKAFLFIE